MQEEELEEVAVNKMEGRDNTHGVVMKTSDGGRRRRCPKGIG